MQFNLITNSGVKNLNQELSEQLKIANTVNIAVAFITKEGLDLLKIFLKSNKNKFRHCKLLTGLYHCFNSKEVLFELNEMADKSKGVLEVHLSKTERFHWKYYSFDRMNELVYYIGSANFTKGGLTGNGELQTKLTIGIKDKSIRKDLDEIFNKEWANSEDISVIPLNKYKEIHLKSNINILDPAIRNLLFKSKKLPNSNDNHLPGRLVIFRSDLSKTTERLITKHQSHWDQNNWNYFACESEYDYQMFFKTKTIFIISKLLGNYTFEIGEIKDYCKLKTPDGYFFIAYTPRKRPKKENPHRREKLEELGFSYHSRKFCNRNLGIRQSEKILDMFS